MKLKEILSNNANQFAQNTVKLIEDHLPTDYSLSDITIAHNQRSGIKEYYYQGQPVLQLYPEKWKVIETENSRILQITQQYRPLK